VICKISLANHLRIVVKENHSTIIRYLLELCNSLLKFQLLFNPYANKKKGDVPKTSHIIILMAMPTTE